MSLPYFPMYPTDFEADTSHLTLEEDGAYNRLLRLMWMMPGCSLPDDDAWIRRRMRVDQETYERVVLVVIDEFFVRSKGRLSNARLTKEFEQSKVAHEKRVSAGKKGGKSKSLKNNDVSFSNAKAKPKQPEPEPEPYVSTNVETNARARASAGVDLFGTDPPKPNLPAKQMGFTKQEFENWWIQYPHKVGKGDAEKKFMAIGKQKKATLQELHVGLKKYVSTKPVDRAWCNPSTWLNQERWSDEPAITSGRNASGKPTGTGSIVAGMAKALGRRNHVPGWDADMGQRDDADDPRIIEGEITSR